MTVIESSNPAAAVSPAEAVLNALPLAVMVIAPDGRIKDANVAAEDFFDMSVAFLRRRLPGQFDPMVLPQRNAGHYRKSQYDCCDADYRQRVPAEKFHRVVAPIALARPARAQGAKLGSSLIGKLEGPTVITDPAQLPKSYKEAPMLAELVKAGKLPPIEPPR